MRVYVIRHGESETNLANKWTGWLDVHLTEKGKKDAMRAGEVIKNVKFDRIFSSDLTRAKETAKGAIPDCEPELSPLLREVNVGNIAGGPLDVITPEEREACREYGYSKYGGESKEEFISRINEFKTRLEALDCDNVAVFSHAGWLRAMLDTVVGITLPRNGILCKNGTVGIFDYSNGVWRLHSWINLS